MKEHDLFKSYLFKTNLIQIINGRAIFLIMNHVSCNFYTIKNALKLSNINVTSKKHAILERTKYINIFLKI